MPAFRASPSIPRGRSWLRRGATEAIAGALLALIEPGDEVVLFQPLYDAYLPLVRRAGGVPRFVTLKPPHWTFEDADLERAFSPRTRVVLFNNPQNPTGVMADAAPLDRLARFCVAHDAVAICDEVWEHVTFDGRTHTPLMSRPGMRERTVKIGSAGKIFSLTGWKVGFVMAAPPLMSVLAAAHQFITFTTPPNLQTAVAYGLGKDDDYFVGMRAALARSRDIFEAGLTARGFTVLPCASTYFTLVDLGEGADDVAYCTRLVHERGVAAIPVSAFYAEEKMTRTVRFCFAKRDETLAMALERLR